jgi:Type I phosphodiesterase / nucleotide pyrophosphatase
MPTMREFLRDGASASGNGLLTQAPPNTGAGWYTLATGAWPGVAGSTNNTFHVNGQPFANRTGAFDPNVLQAESIAQSAERAGLKVAQVEWAGGRNATIQGPTIDFRTFLSGRGVATNFIGQAGDTLFDDASFIASFGLQFDTPAGHAGQAPFPGAAPTPATGSEHPPRWQEPQACDSFGVGGSNPAPGCFAGRGRGGECRLTCDSRMPVVTAGAPPRTSGPRCYADQHGPGSGGYRELGKLPPAPTIGGLCGSAGVVIGHC